MSLLWIYLAGFAFWYSVGVWLMAINENDFLKALFAGLVIGAIWPFMLCAFAGIITYEGVYSSRDFWIETLWTGAGQ